MERFVRLWFNTLPGRLAEELALADLKGVMPIQVGTAAFDTTIRTGTIKWVVMPDGDLLVMPKYVDDIELAHSVLARGEPVQAAGEARVIGANGLYIGLDINNWSGHYRPDESAVPIGRWAFEARGIRFL